jgi:integrase
MESLADRRGLSSDPRALDNLTLGDLLVRYRDTVATAKRSAPVETIILTAFLRHRLASVSLASLSPSHFSAYRDERLGQVEPSTIIRELGLLQHALETAKRDWAIPLTSNPLKLITKPKAPLARERRLKEGELGFLMEACRDCRNAFIGPLIVLALETAMRLGELLRIEKGHIRQESQTLITPTTKNGHPRTIPLTPAAMLQLQALAPDFTGRLIPTSASAVKQAWRRLQKRADISDLHFHDLRHEAITRLFEYGLSLPEVALISGHRDPRMLFRYTHLRAEDVAKKLNTATLATPSPDHR